VAIRIVVWCLLIGLSPWWSLDRDRLGEASKHQATGQAVRGGGAAFRLNTRKQDLVAGTGDVRSSAAPAKQGPGGDQPGDSPVSAQDCRWPDHCRGSGVALSVDVIKQLGLLASASPRAATKTPF